MGKIKVLDKLTANMISAGEVVERPASVVKEVFENSLDATSHRITIEIKDGGKELIKITDDGTGMDRDDAQMCILRHSTSKISGPDDLFDIRTMGFRGEAMASIAAVSKLTIITRKEDTDTGSMIVVKGGEIVSVDDTGCPVGTTVIVEDLFFNTPARLKFLKKSSTESAHIEEMIGKLILANPEISVRFIKDGKEIFYSKGDGDLKGAIYCVYGSTIAENLVEVNGERGGVKVSGYVGSPNIAKPSLKFENFCVNGRICRTKTMVSALDFAYFQKMAQGKHPFCVLNIGIDYEKCDVNVHPQKAEVKFSDENLVYEAISSIARNALDNTLFIKKSEPDKKTMPEYPVNEVKKEYEYINNKNDLPFKKVTEFNFLGTEKSENKEDKSHILKFSEPTFFEIPKKEEIFTVEPKEEKKAEIKEEIKEEKQAVNETFIDDESYKIIGQIFSTYIIIEKGDEMILMDQHAAHERMNYEMLREHYKNNKASSQMLMIPQKVELSATEHTLVNENKEVFYDLGIEIEDFGDNTIIVRSIPTDVKKNSVERLIYEIIDEISKKGTMSKEDFNQRLLYLVACKMSIKANMALTKEDTESLVKRAFQLNGKTTCPHGRPLFVSYKKISIETKFER